MAIDRDVLPTRIAADGARGFQAIQHRHLDVHQDQVDRPAPGDFQFEQRLPAVVGDVDLIALLAQDRQHDFLIDQIVFHQQQTQCGRRRKPAQRNRPARRRRGPHPGSRRGRLARQRDREGAALPNFAFAPRMVPVMHLHQLARDGQAEPGAAVLARDAAVGLREFLKNRRQLVGGNAGSGVGHRDRQIQLAVRGGRA